MATGVPSSSSSNFSYLLLFFLGCSVEQALEAASLHPAQLLGISHQKGKLDYGSDAGQELPRRAVNHQMITGRLLLTHLDVAAVADVSF